MTERAKRAYAEWQAADALARIAEGRLKSAWEIYDREHGAPPTPDLMAEVSRLRTLANEKLTTAMMMIGAASKPKA